MYKLESLSAVCQPLVSDRFASSFANLLSFIIFQLFLKSISHLSFKIILNTAFCYVLICTEWFWIDFIEYIANEKLSYHKSLYMELPSFWSPFINLKRAGDVQFQLLKVQSKI